MLKMNPDQYCRAVQIYISQTLHICIRGVNSERSERREATLASEL